MESKHLKTEGIILIAQPYLEADSLLKILSPTKGLLSAIARGARKVTSKRAGVIQPFNQVLFELYRGTTFFVVVQAKNIHPFAYLASDFEKGVILSFAAELVAATHQDEQLINGAYGLLLSLFKLLEEKKAAAGFVYLAGFMLSYLNLIGYRLPVEQCKSCGSSFESLRCGSIKPEEAVFLCSSCSGEENPFFEELKAVVRASYLLESLAEMKKTYPFGAAVKVKSPISKSGLLDAVEKIYRYTSIQAGIELKSYPLLKQAIESIR